MNDPPTALVGFRKSDWAAVRRRLSMNHPPTALVGLWERNCAPSWLHFDSQDTVLRSASSAQSFDADQDGPSANDTLVTCRRMTIRSGSTAPNFADTLAVSPE